MDRLQTILHDLKAGRISKAEALRLLNATQHSHGTDVLMFAAQWRATSLVPAVGSKCSRVLLVCDQLGTVDGAKFLCAGTGDAVSCFEQCALQLLTEIKQLISSCVDVLVQVVIPAAETGMLGLAGLLQTASKENPRLRTQLLAVEAGTDVSAIADIERGTSDTLIRYNNGVRQVLSIEEGFAAPAKHPWREDGVYLITGGTGGLGMLMARDILKNATHARVILVGRSPQPAQALTPSMSYRQLDISDADAVNACLNSIRAEFGAPNGILHCAGVLRDGFLLHKQAADVQAVMAPKIRGLVNLAAASATDQLDMFVVFSSLAAVIGNVGQADYALANSFMDHYAASHARMLSINWPLWSDGGMRIDAASAEALHEQTGLTAMSTPDGLQAFYRAVASGAHRALVAAGERDKIAMLFKPKTLAPSATAPSSRAQTLEALKTLFAACAKLPVTQLDAHEPLQNYGIDSIMITRLNQKLAAQFGELPKTLFYQHRTLAAVADYLDAHHTNQTQAELTTQRNATQQPIAIIGISGRYPQARTLEEFWDKLKHGRDCVTEIPPERWSLDGFFEADHQKAVAQGKSYAKWGGFIEGFAEFDPLFFGISPREAQTMDPQERLFIESCWQVLEDAALSKQTIAADYHGRVGVFAGITKTGFNLYGPPLWQDGKTLQPRTSFSSVANRVSYLFDFKGPSVPVDTMCSSSLTAIHQACESLRNGDCELAIAGGVNLYLHPSSYVELCATHMLSANGRCHSFGEGGDGFVPGEGVGCVLLKPLAKAIADGDQIHAVIRGTHINHGGKTHGYTVPNPTAQSELIRATLDKAGVDARSISYVEAHGTGTEMGDPIEIAGLTEAFRADTSDVGFCALGSAKSNIGHLEAAAGIAGLTKIVLQFKHQQLAPSLHAATPNQHIDFARSPFVVQQGLTPWRRDAQPLRAAISSFGAGGANAHVVLEEYIDQSSLATQQVPSAAIVLSARSEQALLERAVQLLNWLGRAGTSPANGLQTALQTRLASMLHVDQLALELDVPVEEYGLTPLHFAQLQEEFGLQGSLQDNPTIAAMASNIAGNSSVNLADLAYTLQTGREAMAYRLGCVVASIAELTDRLKGFVAGDVSSLQFAHILQSSEARISHNAAAVTSSEPAQMLALWLKGQSINWSVLYTSTPRRISLPSYPFERNRYWIADQIRQEKPAAVASAISVVENHIAQESITQTIIDKLCAALDLTPSEIRGEQSFADYGLDSILGVNLVNDLNATFALTLDTTTLFDYSTLDKLSALIHDQYKAPVAAVTKTQASTHHALEPIAIIGISGRFPQSENPQQLWQHLAAGRDLVEPVSRWPLTEEGGCRHGGFVDGIDQFDPLFFNISGLEASYMDPQQRVFLQEAWKALEDAGYAGTAVAGRGCGVYVGCCGGDYQDLFLGKPSAQSLWGNMASVIPSRIAYYLDLKGPALAIDTSCSSSLVAIDLACKDLRSGETEMALAGGVFLQATPKLYSSANRAGMLSPSGRCHAFAAQADGFVPGEGAAVLILKRLSEAQADGDHIYGVIRGSGVNQDGATNGITAPSAKSQEALLRHVYQRFGIDAAGIQMLEAHGTGTRLGDPIEFSALTKAFRAATDQSQYCALGSLKSNIGHSQYAAGVAGVMKILLALQHQQIPPSLHFHSGNPAIEFSSSPFFVNTSLRSWPVGKRLAAVSSFGASGTNAHVVIGEAPVLVRQHDSKPAWLVVLSARTEAQLQQQAKQLLEHCGQEPTLDLGNLSFALLTGRKHFEQRLAIVARDLAELQAALAAPVITTPPTQRQSAATLAWQQAAARLPTAPSVRAVLEELAAAFLAGATASSAGLFGEGHSRLSLPTYPFARDRYWVDEAQQTQPQSQATASKQRSSALCKGNELFLADHKVQGKTIMPGVVALEMARSAMADKLGRDTGIRLSDVVWLSPLAGPASSVVMELSPDNGDRMSFKICDAANTQHVYTQGFAEPLAAAAAHHDLAALRSACTTSVVSREQCYQAIRAMGIEHGPRLQAVQEIRVGSSVALARLELREVDTDALVLHPGMLDGAIQASIGLLMGRNKSALPFALQTLEVHAPCTAKMWAVIHLRASSTLEKIDIDVCDDNGLVCARMIGYSSRVLEQDAPDAATSVLMQPVWDVRDLPSAITFTGRMLVVGANAEALQQLAPYAPQILSCEGSIAQLTSFLTTLPAFDHVVWIGADAEPQAASTDSVSSAFRLIKALLGAGHDARSLRWTIITLQCQPVWQHDTVLPSDAGLHGLFGSLAKEYPNWPVRIADVEAHCELPLATIFTLPFDARGDAWALRQGQWYRRSLLPVTASTSEPTRYRQHGVYVVIGGAGGVGAVWTDYMVNHYQARVVWVGRSIADTALQQRLTAYNGAVSYLSVDATDQAALQTAQQHIEQILGQIHGIVHSAIVLLDQGLAKMDEQRFSASYRAKAEISKNIAAVFCRRPLDFVLFFSSIQSFAKMPGQSNYAAGCTFKDAFAHQLGQQGSTPVKVMNWGYWGKVGIVAGEHYQQRMAQAGLASLDTRSAMAALETLLSGSIDQLALAKTTRLEAIDGMDPGHAVEVYPPTLQPCVAELGQNFRPQQALVNSMRAKVGAQMSEMDVQLAHLLFAQMSDIGFFAGQSIAAMQALLPPLYQRWFEESLVVLIRHGWINADGAALKTVNSTTAWADWDREKAPWLQDDNRRAQVVLVETMLCALPEILQGRRPATDAMFPQSSLKLVEGIYKHNLVADYFNEVLTDVLVAYIEKRLALDPSTRLRILEIGAGTGGTSARAFVKLRPYQQHIEEYCYTDLSKAFLMHAQREYGGENPYLSYKIFNVGKPLAGQNIAPGAFDIVIATNVLHATRNIRTTMRNAKAAMRKHGLLLLNELSDNVLFSHLTFGLLEGWWLYDDAPLRIPGSPGLYPQSWQAMLAQEGFGALAFPAEAAHGMGQQIIVGESDGVVRQIVAVAQTTSPPVAASARTLSQVAVAATPAAVPLPPVAIAASSAPSLDAVRDKARSYFRAMVGETIRIPASEIEASTPLERYGIDSILVVQLTSKLRTVLSDISSTLFFEVQTINGLIDHLIETQLPALAALLGVTVATAPASQQPQQVQESLAPTPKAGIANSQDIAIIGLSGRYPQAANVDRFWQNLRDGRNCITEIPPERWNWRDYFDAEPGKSGSMYSKFGGFLDGIANFDPLFFHIAPAEAERMDPQERLFLQQAYSAIEDAGYTPASLGGKRKVGVFVGVMNGRYATGAAFWSVANRVSYLLNLTGPSLSVDTACSSSLTALHLAVESLNSGMSDCAIAGGVNLVVDPQHYVTLSEMVMLSPSDRCKPFGNEADGFIDGEAVAALVLKPLAMALADGDQIYGVIKGTAINTGGKTNSYTVPNPVAQAKVVQDACERASVDPRTISYIEAHGTGTALGDPIEIAGLTRAFRTATSDRNFCAVGSVKSNIGHCESAAGVAGITKVLMQFKHGLLAPSLHADTLNPQIDFDNSPFVVQTALAAWPRPVIDAREYPRRAGVSSFGAGGANAHVVLEEFVAAPRAVVATGAVPILLSAKSEERLRAVAANLLDFLAEHPDTNIADLAFTLQVGRVMMEHRLALMADTLTQVQDKLRAYLAGGTDCLVSDPHGKRDALATYDGDAEMRRMFAAWAAQGQYDKLIGLWARGANIAWAEFAPHGGVKRISLPTYPFAEEHYWMARAESRVGTAQVHPLLHVNSSNLDGLRFTSMFNGKEFFLADHRVQGRSVLPGVAYLEMARAAMEKMGSGGDVQVVLGNVVWAQPFVVGVEPADLHISLSAQEDGRVAFKIYSDVAQHSQGLAQFTKSASPVVIDLAALQSRMTRAQFTPDQCYAAFTTLGIEYGPAHRCIEAVMAGPDEVLTHLSLPAGTGAFVLHPGLMDSALQSSLALLLNDAGGLTDATPMLPFALAQLEILAPCETSMWAWVAPAAGNASSAVQKLDITLCNDSGRVCVRLLGFAARRLSAAPAVVAIPVMAAPNVDALHERTNRYLKNLLAGATKLAADRIGGDVSFEEYGLDSVMVIKLTGELEKTFGSLSKTLFFEYRNLSALADYFVAAHAVRLGTLFGTISNAAAPLAARAVAAPAPKVQPTQQPQPSPTQSNSTAQDIAIIGLSGRYPMAPTLAQFWANLRDGVDCITEVPAERWDHSQYFDPDNKRAGTTNSKWGGFLDGVDMFDPLFFNIAPRDAQIIDPQERLFLEAAYHAVEDAGYTRQTLATANHSVGVFVGVMYEEYQLYGAQQTALGNPMALSGSPSSIANRVSYFLDLNGPSMAVDTMCSSSLTALHLACQSLLQGDCAMAIAGGVNLTLHPNKYQMLGLGKFASSKGRCESFGEGGDGYVPAEGVGAVLLKPLAQAIADGDHIYGLIKGSAINHGGKTNAYTVPNPQAQAAVVARAFDKAGVAPRTISYIEAHGTGTALGDPIEIAGLTNSFRADTGDTGFCAIGSAKSNIGHCESAAGIAGLTKVLLQLKHRQLVPSLHSTTLNTNIDFASTPFVVQQQLAPWQRPRVEVDGALVEVPLRAGISSFGAGGANAHLVIEEYVAPVNVTAEDGPAVIVLSAKSSAQLTEMASKLLAWLHDEQCSLQDVAYTLQIGREAMDERFGLVASSLAELRGGLREFIAGYDSRGRQYRGNVRAGKAALSAFLDEDLRGALTSWIEKRKYEKLLELWVQGLQFDWRQLHVDSQPQRISLPVYPFARSRYWIPDGAAAPATASAAVATPILPTALPMKDDMVLLHPVWREQALTPASISSIKDRRVLLCGIDGDAGVDAITQVCAGADAGARFESAAESVFDLLQTLIREKLRAPVLVQVVTPEAGEGATFTALAAMLKTAQLENPHIRAQQIALSSTQPLAEILLAESKQATATQVRYRAGRREVLQLDELSAAHEATHPWRDDGVYLITGGAGAVGLLFARAIVRATTRAIVIITGRKLDFAEVQYEERIVYRQLDVTDAAAVRTAVTVICSEFGKLNGILHSAGVLRDAYLLKKTRSDFNDVVVPKVRGLVNLDLASRDLPLDMFVAFSSLAAISGNPGQVDYAGANAFLDQYASYRNSLVRNGERSGHSLSVNWPLWAEGGMRPDPASIERMRDNFGLAPMPSDAGLLAFYQALASGGDQVLVAVGERNRILNLFNGKPLLPAESLVEPSLQPLTEPSTELHDSVRARLRQIAAELIKVAPELLEFDISLSEYGYDSVSMTEFANKLNNEYELELTPTLCFEYPTIAALTEHLISTYPLAFTRRHAPTASRINAAPARVSAPVKAPLSQRMAPPTSASATEAFAIVGISCCMPKAADLAVFWDNLVEARDCISEIPASRWDWRSLRGAQTGEDSGLKWGGFIDDIAQFDPLFFGISPREAEIMDPQQRQLMMHVWKAIEDAGYSTQQLSGSRTALFVGTGQSGYSSLFSAAQRAQDGYSATANVASIGPNRMSYLLNLHGPSQPIETACSSSLVAINRGVAVLRDGSCDMAIVGGVNLMVTPEAHLSFDKAGMLSADGRCKAFSAQANGYVRGEGVGMLVLKRLSDAQRDGDSIYALIRGCSENHGGRASSLTAPNPHAQAALLKDAYERAGIDVRSVSYIEAHGTGTKLGDPVEISGLKSAFGETGQREFCGLGSVKSNIGHLELAAGVAGVIKVVLQMKHKLLVKSLHCEEVNPYIGLKQSPFYLVQKNMPWQAQTDAAGHELPRRAGVSSFGFGGVNAHVVIEEYIATPTVAVSDEQPSLIVLSARSGEALAEVAGRLLRFLQSSEHQPPTLAAIAYTLQTGRDAMDERVGWSVSSHAELIINLRAFVTEGALNGGLRGQVKRNKESLAALADDEDMPALLNGWIAKRKYARLLDVWTKGLQVNWHLLYPHGKPQRVNLPSYPFAKEHYWAPPIAAEAPGSALLHPLLHANTSDFSGQSFTSHFTGNEFFLADHKVQGQAILPAVAYLEMAHAAIAQTIKGSAGIVLSNVVWARPYIAAATAAPIHVKLAEQGDGRIAFEIFSGEEEAVLHSQGVAEICTAPTQARVLDIAAIERRMTRGKLSGAQCYAAFSAMGMVYGPGHRGINMLHGGNAEALAHLSLPLPGTAYALPPGLLDSAMQASLGLLLTDDNSLSGNGMMLPFAVNKVELLAPCTSEMWAWVSANGNKFDIALCDEAGKACVSLSGISTRQLAATATAAVVTKPAVVTAPSRTFAIGELQGRVRAALLPLAAALIKVRPEDIDSNGDLSEYGFDSISLTELANKLNHEYELELMPTLFFEYSSIDELVSYLVDVHHDAFARRYAPQEAVVPREATPSATGHLPADAPMQPRVHAKISTHAPMQKAAAVAPDLSEAIAIIGMSGRMPMADDLDAFWNNLVEGRDCISEIPASRWDWKALLGDARLEVGKTNVKWAGFIDGVDQFDPQFFGLTPREAEVMDPQQRLLMLYVWKAIEDAGYAAQTLSGSRTAMFVGTGASSYGNVLANSANAADAFNATGVVASIGPNRMSYFLDLHGPSEPIETACSSSLIAINRGVAVLRDGSCEVAIVGGVNTIVSPHAHISFDKAGMLSADGRCKTFSAQANGYVRGEGVGMLVLKRLSDAQRDGDHVHGLIRGCAQNHGGRASSLTAPNPVAQTALLKEAYAQAGIDPRSISYIEAHGTGTKLGDPVEISGLKNAFGETGEHEFCGLGSVKSNIGHLELAAGVAGIIKVLLQMKHKLLVKSLHCEEVNPYIALSQSPFYLVQKNTPWQARVDAAGRELPRRAGVSSFGFGGVNAHVVMEEYIAMPRPVLANEHPALIVLSARDAECLPSMAANLLAFLRANSIATDSEQALLSSVAYTLQIGRDAMDERIGWVVSSLAELMAALQAFINDGNVGGGVRGQAKRNREAVALLAADEDTPALLDTWLAKGKYLRLIELWSKGLAIDWRKLYSGVRPQRISLPTYPFALARYWPEAAATQSASFSVDVPTIEVFADASSVLGRVIACVAKLSGLPEAGLTNESELYALGLDSVALLQLAAKLMNAFPALDRQADGDALLRCASIGALVDYIEHAGGPTTATIYPFMQAVTTATEAVRNIALLCADLLIEEGAQLRANAAVVVDESHPFFFDHPLDHVSGLHLGAAMSEVVQTAHRHLYALAPNTALFVTTMTLDFAEVCRKEPAALVHVVAAGEGYYEASVSQDERVMARAKFQVRTCAVRLPATPTPLLPLRPACQRQLNKHNAANVLLSEVAGSALRPGAWLLPKSEPGFFTDFSAVRIDAVVLAEAARQGLRLFFADGQERAEAVSVAMQVDLLKKLEVQLQRPLYWDEAVYLELTTHDKLKIGSATRLHLEGNFMVAGVAVGSFTASALSLSGALHEHWGRQERNPARL